MRDEQWISAGLNYLLVAAKVGAALAFAPLPGWRAASAPARIVLIAALSTAAWAAVPSLPTPPSAPGQLALRLLQEAASGVAVGLAVACLLEAFVLAAQLVASQAGYAYASMIDPNSQADSGILPVLSQLLASLLFLALDLDRFLLRALVQFGAWRAGSIEPRWEQVVQMTADMWQTAFRLAIPAVAFLILLDVALALSGRVNAHLQLLSLAFPAKMLGALVVMAAVLPVYPMLLRWQAERLAAFAVGR